MDESRRLLSESEAATYCGLSPDTLRQSHRYKRKGPAFVKLGSRILYRLCDLDEWIESRVVRSEDQQ